MMWTRFEKATEGFRRGCFGVSAGMLLLGLALCAMLCCCGCGGVFVALLG